MQTIIAGFSDKNELGYDNSQHIFVVRNQNNQTFPSSVTFKTREVSAKIKEYIRGHEISTVELDQLILTLKQRSVEKLASQNPLIKDILSVAQEKLKVSKDREGISSVAKVYANDILAPPFKIEDLKEEFKQKRNFKIVLANYPEETSHTVYCYDPEKRMVSKGLTNGLGIESIEEIAALIRRKWQAQDAFIKFQADKYPRLKVFRLDSDHKLSEADLKSQTFPTVFIQVSQDCSCFRAICYFEKSDDNIGKIINLTSKNLSDLEALLKDAEQLVQIFSQYQENFVSATRQGSISKESFINDSKENGELFTDKIWLEVLKDGRPVIRVYYLDLSENKV